MNGLQSSGAATTAILDSSLARESAKHFHRPITSGLKIKLVDPTQDSSWDSQLAHHREQSVFHTAAWARVLRETYGHKAFYLSAFRNGELVALLPIMEVSSACSVRRGVALPFTDVCGALTFEDFEVSTLTEDLAALARKQSWRYLEVRDAAGFEIESTSLPTFYGHVLDLSPGIEKLRAGLSGAVRRGLGKAERAGLVAEIAQTREAVAQFYQLHQRTRQRHGAPPQPWRFFENIYRHLIAPGLGFLVIVKKASQPIAAAVFLTSDGNALYKFGSSDERKQQHRANNLAMWEAILHLCTTGHRKLHFGRTSPGNEGLRRFKLGWGAVEAPIHYRRLNPATGDWTTVAPDSPSVTRHVFRLLPTWANRWAGAMLYPHLD